jgi:hypothetical protein
MKLLTDIYLPILRSAQHLGLVAPCLIREWSEWYAETFFASGRLPVVRLSRGLLKPRTCKRIMANYQEYCGECTAAGLVTHELGHVFCDAWRRNRKVAPLRGYRRVFNGGQGWMDPYNDMLSYFGEHPDEALDTDNYLNWYAWSDDEEDFCECFLAVVEANGDIEPYRTRPGVYRKMKFILNAGQAILKSTPFLREANRRDMLYLTAGDISHKCPKTKRRYGVPDKSGTYICPCGEETSYDGNRVKHGSVR